MRNYFWELETALGLALLLAARQARLAVPEPPTWEQLVTEWRKQTKAPEIIDELEALTFDWHGIDLFEVRTYAELSRTGALAISCSVSVATGEVSGVFLPMPCRRGGQQVFFPDGLDRFMESSRRFVQRLLSLSLMEKERQDQDC